MRKREFVQLAQTYVEGKHSYNGWYASEKLDGQRAIYLPFTRGENVSSIPFANRERDSRDHISTGLWSRYGKPIFAPDWWLDKLPPDEILDGELYLGRGNFQTLSSYIRKHPAQRLDSEWRNVKFHIFDVPDACEFFSDGRIYTPNYKYVFQGLLPERETPLRLAFLEGLNVRHHNFRDFEAVCDYLQAFNFGSEPVANWHPQLRLPFHTDNAKLRMDNFYNEILEGGGEGVILRKYTHTWEPTRTTNLLKVKPTNDDEGRILGFTLGIGKLEGMFGALVLSWKDQVFEISGFTNEERRLNDYERWSKAFEPKVKIYPELQDNFSPYFKIGEKITFSYRELTDRGIPKDARFLRKRHHDE